MDGYPIHRQKYNTSSSIYKENVSSYEVV